ncbi:hypothetical protein [Planctobacterium marinum]|uniref:hypothetical protein n=1 Tax=Planctobacterium marinum TaxID=1631968 RepID=UPI001E45B816|nr:hypothetical protein [Planctobacterium marinum]MCC2606385.1 hypothetical protein [Planctobacterium marinum]
MNRRQKTCELHSETSVANKHTIEAFSLATSQNLKLNLKAIWEELARQSRGQENVLCFPYHLIRQQSEQQAVACRHSYSGTPLTRSESRHIQSIEVEILALDTAFKCSSFNVGNEFYADINRLLLALKIIFQEFKDNINADYQARLVLFEQHITQLIAELVELITHK